jgi:hypothetical protein
MGRFRPASQHGQLGPEANTAHGRPNMNSTVFYLFKKNSNGFELSRLKYGLPLHQKFQVKYEFVENKIMNNFYYWNFSKFRIEFESQIKEALVFEIQ